MEILLFAVLGLGVPTLLAVGVPMVLSRASPRLRLPVIASVAVCFAVLGLVDPLWGHRATGFIFVITFFLVLAIIGAAASRDGARAKAGLAVLAIGWICYLLVSVVASGQR